jgi:hypothetical protein
MKDPNQQNQERQQIQEQQQTQEQQQQQIQEQQQIDEPDFQTFKKTTYWHQQSKTMENINQENLLNNILECLLRMEAKLIEIERLL